MKFYCVGFRFALLAMYHAIQAVGL